VDVDDGWAYAGMQNADKGLAPVINCTICPVTEKTDPKMRSAPAIKMVHCFGKKHSFQYKTLKTPLKPTNAD